MCPFWSGIPYEMLIIPRTHSPHLHRSTPSDLAAVGRTLRTVLGSLARAPRGRVVQRRVPLGALPRAGAYHWHVHVLPKLTTTAGFEAGTGVLINILPPEQATEELRSPFPPEPDVPRRASAEEHARHVAVQVEVDGLRLRHGVGDGHPHDAARLQRHHLPVVAVVHGGHGLHPEAGGEDPVEG